MSEESDLPEEQGKSPDPSPDLPDDEYGRPPRVFISYRRDDCADVARRLAAQLRPDLASEVFFDKDPIAIVPGDRWREQLADEIGRSDVFVCLVGERWPGYQDSGSDEGDRPRISREDDVVRAEVEAALETEPFPHIVVIFVDLDQTSEEQLRRAAADLLERFDDLQRIETTGKEIRRRRSAPYQSLLVASWVALKDRIPDSILIVGDRQEMADLDGLVDDLRSAGRIDPKQFRSFRSGAYVVRRNVRKRRFALLKKDLPDAIIAVSPEEPTDEMTARVLAVVSHPAIKTVGFVAVGGLGAGVGTALTQQAISLASSSGTTVTTTGTVTATAAVPAASGVASLTVVGKVAAAAVLVAGVSGAAVAVDTALGDPPVEANVALAGDWEVDTFTLDEAEGAANTGTFGPLDGGQISFAPTDPACSDRTCELEVTSGPDFLLNAELSPNDDGGYDVDFAVDETETIQSMVGFQVTCQGRDITDTLDLVFDAEVDDATGGLDFLAIVSGPPTDGCDGGRLVWSAAARPL